MAATAGGYTAFRQDLFSAFRRHQRRHVVRAARLHQVQRLVVEKRAVFDRVDAGADRTLRAFSAVGVRGGLLSQGVRFVDDGVQFVLGELRDVRGIGQREDATGGADLDDVGAVLDVVPHRLASLFGAVDDALFRTTLVAEETGTHPVLVVAMAAGQSNRVSRDQHARSQNHPSG